MRLGFQLLVLGFLLVPLSGFAKGVVCQPNRYSTHWMVSVQEKEVVLKVLNPMGYTFMSQMETVSESSVPFLKLQSQDLQGLGDYFEYRWPKSQCTVSEKDQSLVRCEGKVSALQAENKIPSLGFTTARVKEESLSGQQEYHRVRAIFEKDNIYFVTIPTAVDYCRVF
ncbi:hypothetical protein BDW_06630 [Bdellovibrio bacteriovorus W]|nr:hypothetical protein BDW_06630 [Bdellovibrio bacteriovorus W]